MDALNTISSDDRARIEQQVAEVERHTSAEVVCAMATASGRYDRAESIIGLAFGLLALGMVNVLQGWASSGAWTAGVTFGWQVLAVVAGFVAGSVSANRFPALRSLVVSEAEMEAEVRQAAAHVFLLGAVANTVNRTGLLIFFSLVERRVVILADESVREALGNDEIGRLRDVAVGDLKRGDVAAAFIDVLREVGPRLAEVLPASRELNADELPNHVLLFHPRPGCESIVHESAAKRTVAG